MFNYLNEIFLLLGSDKRRLPFMLLMFLSISILDLIGIGLIGPYLSVVLGSTASSNITNYLSDWGIVISNDSFELLMIMSYLILGVFLIKTIVSIYINYIILRFGADQQIRIRSKLMKSYQFLPYTVFLQRNSSEYIHYIHKLVDDYADGVVKPLMKMVSDGTVSLFLLGFLAWSDPISFLILVILLSTVTIGYDMIFKNKIYILGKEANNCATTMVKAIQEGISGLKEIRILGREKYFSTIVKDNSRKYADYHVRSSILNSVPRYLLEFIMILFIVTLVLIALFSNQDLQELIPTLGIFGVAAIRLVPATNVISTGILRMRFNRDSVSRLYHDVLNENFSKIINTYQINNEQCSLKSLSIRDVSFFYPGSSKPSLQKVSININAGESIGIIGTSGSGKTTLVDLILGLLKPQKGEVFFNGAPLEGQLKNWQNIVAYLPQQVTLLDSSLRQNIVLNIEDIDESHLLKSIDSALLTELVKDLPKGLDTFLGEKGVRLSGGQRQRVALARAFYHKREVLVLDEATSALDNESEEEIVKEIELLKGRKTTIIIAHRLSTVRHCDQIYKFEKGKLVSSGTPKEIFGLENNIG